jgi:hypothetical protein
MPLVNCPKCQTPLDAPEDLLGKMVRCPGCGDTFTAQRPLNLAFDPSRWQEPPDRASADMEWRRRDDEGGYDVYLAKHGPGSESAHARGRLGRAALCLHAATAFGVITTLGWLVLSLLFGLVLMAQGQFVQGVCGGCCSLLPFIPLIFMFIGALNLGERKSWGFALAGAIIAIVMGCLALVQCLGGGLIAAGLLNQNSPAGFLVGGLELCGNGPFALLSLGGGIDAIVVLSNQHVKKLYESPDDRWRDRHDL